MRISLELEFEQLWHCCSEPGIYLPRTAIQPGLVVLARSSREETRREVTMKTRDEIVETLMATVSESRLYDHFDVRIVVEGFADQLVLINDEHHRQIALAKAMFDAEIDTLKRELASAKLAFDLKTHKVLKRLSLGLQGVVSDSIDVIDQFISQPPDTHAEYSTKLAQAKEKFDREIAALRQELVQAYQELAILRVVDALDRSGRGPDDVLN
jgi:hypothetical protein